MMNKNINMKFYCDNIPYVHIHLYMHSYTVRAFYMYENTEWQ